MFMDLYGYVYEKMVGKQCTSYVELYTLYA